LEFEFLNISTDISGVILMIFAPFDVGSLESVVLLDVTVVDDVTVLTVVVVVVVFTTSVSSTITLL
jgi:hypothetical protein